jgi:7-cyano-7-deazaguanine synthase
MHILLLLSGGIDSVTMLYHAKHLGHHVDCLCFDYKQRHRQELLWAKHHASICQSEYHTTDLGGLTEQSWIVPNRNPIFLSIAINSACRLRADAVWIGCNKSDAEAFPDCRPEFFESQNHTNLIVGYSIPIETPFINMTKKEIIILASELGVDVSNTWTCYMGGLSPCGKCLACKTRMEALCGQ